VTGVLATAAPVAARPWGRAALWLLVLAPFFFLSYGVANWLASLRSEVGSVVFAWERNIPFVAWTIIPYWSIDILYGISLFVCATERELDTHVRRLLSAQAIAVVCFILFPLTFTFARPEVDGLDGFLFGSLSQFDKPFNQVPSLHIALLVILWDRYARHVPRWAGWILHAWFTLIGVSVLTTYQHHFVDIPTGAALGFVCLWLWPDEAPGPIMTGSLTHDPRRRRLGLYYTVGALLFCALASWIGGAGLWLIWPAGSLLLVAFNYGFAGPAGFQKSASGHMSPASKWLLAPFIAGAWINSRLWTRNDPAAVAVAGGVSLGRLPSYGSVSSFTTIVDLCAELPGAGGAAVCSAIPMLDLITPTAEQLGHVVGVIEAARASGPVLVCCALGYGRSAAAVAAWLLVTGRAPDLDAAIIQIQQVRPRAVFRQNTWDAIAAAGLPR
jgi:protein-tyrosine phosphatase